MRSLFLSFRRAKWLAAGVVAVTFPSIVVDAEESLNTLTPARQTQVPTVLDISLSPRGELLGAFVDAQGTPISQSQIRIGQHGNLIAKTLTDQSGQFTFAGLRGGLYEIRTEHGGGVFRIWASGTAPPAARQGVVLVVPAEVIRGQQPDGPPLNNYGPPGQNYPVPSYLDGPPPMNPSSAPLGPYPADQSGYYAPTMGPLVMDFLNLGLGITGTTLGIIALNEDAS